MFELWFGIVAAMFIAYVVLDGFDLGAGALHLLVARSDEERRVVLGSIGPFWDANEVWLLASAGALFVAFPRVLAAGLSGFYLAIFLVVWCLILRAIAIEFRSHVPNGLWRAFWDVTFAAASALLPVLFGAALGNIIRGVPLDANGWFQLALFTHFGTHEPVGILDWFTVLAGVFALVALASHGALFLAWRASGPVAARAHRLGHAGYVALAILWPLVTIATHAVNPGLFAALPGRALAWFGAALAVCGVAGALVAGRARRPLTAFLASCAFLAGMLVATAACLFPVLLPSIADPALSLSARAGGATESGLRAALRWWALGAPLAVAYFVLLFRLHRGRAVAARDGEGY